MAGIFKEKRISFIKHVSKDNKKYELYIKLSIFVFQTGLKMGRKTGCLRYR